MRYTVGRQLWGWSVTFNCPSHLHGRVRRGGESCFLKFEIGFCSKSSHYTLLPKSHHHHVLWLRIWLPHTVSFCNKDHVCHPFIFHLEKNLAHTTRYDTWSMSLKPTQAQFSNFRNKMVNHKDKINKGWGECGEITIHIHCQWECKVVRLLWKSFAIPQKVKQRRYHMIQQFHT